MSAQGDAPAGGCMLALCCDYRIIADAQYSLGIKAIRLVSAVQSVLVCDDLEYVLVRVLA